ncbi:MAG: pyruvate formate lyase family protein, partial [Spirochaetota bacterium]
MQHHEVPRSVLGRRPHSGKPLASLTGEDFETCRRLTDAYRAHLNASPEERELAVLRELFPARLEPIRPHDRFAGRCLDGAIGHTSELHGAYVGFYALDDVLAAALEAHDGEYEGDGIEDGDRLTAEQRDELREMIAFWREHATHNQSWRATWDAIQSMRSRIGDDEWTDLPEHRMRGDVGIHETMWFVCHTADRTHPAAADEFALLCIEATRRLHGTRPQTTVRCHAGMNQELYDAAVAAIGEGCTFPMLLNDDVNVSAVARAFAVPPGDAACYVPLGCGEFVLDHTSVCSPNSAFHSLKCLEYALHDGRDALTGAQMGPHTGDPSDFATFDEVWDAWRTQVRFFMDIVARRHAVGLGVVARESPFLLASALTDDCLERGRPLLRGARYVDGSTEVNSFVNTGDSLVAIRRLVFEEERCTLAELVRALDDNWVGHEALRAAVSEIPRYGNDDRVADAMAVRVHDQLALEALSHSGELGLLRRYLIVHVN